jgi:hypothetical protein
MRRHLTDDQRAMIADEEAEYLSRKARKERAQKGRAAGGKATPEQKQDRLPDASSGKRSRDRTKESRQQAAAAHNVSERKVRKAHQVRKANPKLAREVKEGKKTLAQLPRTPWPAAGRGRLLRGRPFYFGRRISSANQGR